MTAKQALFGSAAREKSPARGRAMNYYIATTVAQPFDDVVSEVIERLRAEGFGVLMGAFAISYGSTPRMRWLCYLAAIVTFGTIASIARHHHPLGFLSRWS